MLCVPASTSSVWKPWRAPSCRTSSLRSWPLQYGSPWYGPQNSAMVDGGVPIDMMSSPTVSFRTVPADAASRNQESWRTLQWVPATSRFLFSAFLLVLPLLRCIISSTTSSTVSVVSLTSVARSIPVERAEAAFLKAAQLERYVRTTLMPASEGFNVALALRCRADCAELHYATSWFSLSFYRQAAKPTPPRASLELPCVVSQSQLSAARRCVYLASSLLLPNALRVCRLFVRSVI